MTWYSPDTLVSNQIDYILISTKWKNYVTRSRVYPGIDIGSDHRAIITSLKYKYTKQTQRKMTTNKYDTSSISANAASLYTALNDRFRHINTWSTNVDTLETQICDEIMKTSSTIIQKRSFKKKPWISEDTINLASQRQIARSTKNNTLRNKLSRMINKQIKKDKNKWISDRCDEVDKNIKANRTKLAYDTIKQITNSKSNSTINQIEDSNGNILSDENSILNRWKEYCQNLYSVVHIDIPDSINEPTNINDQYVNPPTYDEVERAAKTLKSNKAPGIDGIQGDILKLAPPEVIKVYHDLILNIWHNESWPKRWCQSIVIPLHKKGSKLSCNNYRTLSLISHPSKILLRIIQNRLQTHAENILDQEQAGFRTGKSTIDQIFTLNQLVEKFLEMDRQIYHIFVDFEKAFDSVNHTLLWKILTIEGIPPKYTNLIRSLYNNANSIVRISNNTSQPFQQQRGVRQGCIISPLIFNLFLQHVINESTIKNIDDGIKVQGQTICYLAFADDIDIVSDNPTSCNRQASKLWETASEYGLKVSVTKTENLVSTKSNNINHNILNPHGDIIKKVNTFKYLGQTINSNGYLSTEIKKRCAIARSALNKLYTLWSCDKITIPSKIRIYKSLVLSTLLYGCETWPLTKKHKKILNGFEMKSYRKILCIKFTQKITNEEVKQRIDIACNTKTKSVIKTITERQLRWYGHTIRRGSNNLSKLSLLGLVSGNPARGRPRQSWTDQLLKEVNLTRSEARQLASNRNLWSAFISRVINS